MIFDNSDKADASQSKTPNLVIAVRFKATIRASFRLIFVYFCYMFCVIFCMFSVWFAQNATHLNFVYITLQIMLVFAYHTSNEAFKVSAHRIFLSVTFFCFSCT